VHGGHGGLGRKEGGNGWIEKSERKVEGEANKEGGVRGTGVGMEGKKKIGKRGGEVRSRKGEMKS